MKLGGVWAIRQNSCWRRALLPQHDGHIVGPKFQGIASNDGGRSWMQLFTGVLLLSSSLRDAACQADGAITKRRLTDQIWRADVRCEPHFDRFDVMRCLRF